MKSKELFLCVCLTISFNVSADVSRDHRQLNPLDWRNQHMLVVQFNFPSYMKNPATLIYIGMSIKNIRFMSANNNEYTFSDGMYARELIINKAVKFSIGEIVVEANEIGVFVNRIKLGDEIQDMVIYSKDNICYGLIMWDYYSDWNVPSNVTRCYPPLKSKHKKK